MAQVTVTIANHIYRVACGEGEEAHLRDLARQIDERIEKLKNDFGEIGDQRLTIMAALTVADELAETRRRIAELEAEIVNLTAQESHLANTHDDWSDKLADTLGEAATRIERIAQNLNAAGRG
jgi:cell division protein ZapA